MTRVSLSIQTFALADMARAEVDAEVWRVAVMAVIAARWHAEMDLIVIGLIW